MQRDSRLQDLSSEHHQALVWAQRIARACAGGAGPQSGFSDEVRAFYDRELVPHFRREEERLLPALREVGESALVDRTLREHIELKVLVGRIGGREGLLAFGERLKAHVRFEERTLFPAAQNRLDAASLDALGSETP